MDKVTYSAKDVEKLFEAGAHLGHKKNRLHPKARKYVYKMEEGVSIIDLTFTAAQLARAKKFVAAASKDGKKMLVVATKKVISQLAQELCQKNNIPYITTKWPPGLLTNFQTIVKNVKKLQELKEEQTTGKWDSFVKHEKIKLNKKLVRLEKFYGGLVGLEKKPDFIFIVDIKKERNALIESRKSKIPVVAIADTNSNPDEVEYPVVANDDAPTSVSYLVSEIINSYSTKVTEKTKK